MRPDTSSPQRPGTAGTPCPLQPPSSTLLHSGPFLLPCDCPQHLSPFTPSCPGPAPGCRRDAWSPPLSLCRHGHTGRGRVPLPKDCSPSCPLPYSGRTGVGPLLSDTVPGRLELASADGSSVSLSFHPFGSLGLRLSPKPGHVGVRTCPVFIRVHSSVFIHAFSRHFLPGCLLSLRVPGTHWLEGRAPSVPSGIDSQEGPLLPSVPLGTQEMAVRPVHH